jgi:tRNA (guanine10-N2)-methyltransferase
MRPCLTISSSYQVLPFEVESETYVVMSRCFLQSSCTDSVETVVGKMQYLIRFAQTHESFRLAEIEAIVSQLNDEYTRRKCKKSLEIEICEYRPESPFCIVRLLLEDRRKTRARGSNDTCPAAGATAQERPSEEEVARDFISRAIQAKAIYELWGSSHIASPHLQNSTTNSLDISQSDLYDTLHASVDATSSHLWPQYRTTSFRFSVDAFKGKRTESEKREIIDSFRYLGFEGKIILGKKGKADSEEWCVFEEYETNKADDDTGKNGIENGDANKSLVGDEHSQSGKLSRLYLGRKIVSSRRHLIEKHDLKKRPYISTTSMDAELALITVNLALASPGKVFLDPFCGTGGFMVAAAELGACVMGCDIDGRSYRGKKGKGVQGGVGRNFDKYGLQALFGDCLTADLVNTPLMLERRWLDGIIADPPYGVREGLKVLGSRKGDDPAAKQPALIDGVPAHTLPGFIAPKKPYSFLRMLDDILDFAARTLVDGGRLAFWMPSANEDDSGEEEVTVIPRHPLMALRHECVQRFNKWSRRLLVYERVPREQAESVEELANGVQRTSVSGSRADDLNPFRRRYFQAFAERPNG